MEQKRLCWLPLIHNKRLHQSLVGCLWQFIVAHKKVPTPLHRIKCTFDAVKATFWQHICDTLLCLGPLIKWHSLVKGPETLVKGFTAWDTNSTKTNGNYQIQKGSLWSLFDAFALKPKAQYFFLFWAHTKTSISGNLMKPGSHIISFCLRSLGP